MRSGGADYRDEARLEHMMRASVAYVRNWMGWKEQCLPKGMTAQN